MAYFTIDEAKSAFSRMAMSGGYARKSADQVVREAVLERAGLRTLQNKFDVFLSHSYDDKEIVLGIKRIIEERGKSVYLD